MNRQRALGLLNYSLNIKLLLAGRKLETAERSTELN